MDESLSVDSSDAVTTHRTDIFNKCILPAVITIAAQYYIKDSRHTGLPGYEYLQELMSNASEARFTDVMRMTRSCFWQFHDDLTEHAGLHHNRHVDSAQKLAIFIHAAKGDSNRRIQETFQHSGDTVSNIIHDVASVMIKFKEKAITLPLATTPNEILNNTK